MTSSYSFRSALNGFNREDVVHYLEYINTKNANQIAQLEGEISRLQTGESWKNRVAELEKENADLRLELETLKLQKPEIVRSSDEELEAYRRAERMERQARERAEQLRQKANGILADTGVKLDASANQIASLADRTAQQLQTLQQALIGSKTALQEASVALRTIRPEEE